MDRDIYITVGSVFILFANANPLNAYSSLIRAGFGCRGPSGFCALLTTLQYATPLILGGLSAAVAFRAGMFSIGQIGQMVLGAAAVTLFLHASEDGLSWQHDRNSFLGLDI